jgi:phosphoglycerol transferase MdoB-like AlkP superfamily enzyme
MNKHSFLHRHALSLPIYSTALLYVFYYCISVFEFDVKIEPTSVPLDFFAQLILAYILYSISRRPWIFFVLHALIMGVLYIGNPIKIAFFGGPLMPDDIFALRSLLLILSGWKFFVLAFPLVALGGLLFLNFKLRRLHNYIGGVIGGVLALTVIYQPNLIVYPIDTFIGTKEWDQRSNYLWQGATIHTLLETARYFLVADKAPDIDVARAAAKQLLAQHPLDNTPSTEDFKPRNVHIVLLESFWDANNLKKVKFSQNPLSDEFRKLWKTANNSVALVPVFAGMTANSEFEVLCGFPVTKNTVKFERQLLNEVPCLPRILADKGYKTVVSHPNVAVFWNRVNAYHRVGFQTYWSEKDFELDDINREFLGDSSLYRQVLGKISSTLESKAPIFDYNVTYFGHWDYPLNESRPPQITSTSKVEEVNGYANTTYYKSREFVEFVKNLQKSDPNGIIVAFGDHLPFLGEHFAGYVESDVLKNSRGEFSDAMYKTYVSTPLLIIDGQKGALKVGRLPLYQVPKLILGLLNIHQPTIMDYTMPPEKERVRPLTGLHFDEWADGQIQVCKAPPYSPECEHSLAWIEAVKTVSNDLFIGGQFTRPLLDKL